MKRVCSELIEFFKSEDGWDKQELLDDYVESILKEVFPALVYADELSIVDGENDIMILSDFAEKLFDKIIDGVCNVIKTA